MNTVTLAGRLTRDTEVREIGEGRKVANFSIAVNKVYFDTEKNKQEKTSFFNCQLFGARADFAGKALLKGTQVFLLGELDQQTWNDKESGDKREKVVVTVNDFEIGRSSNGNGTTETESKTPVNTGTKKVTTTKNNKKDEVPF